MQSKKQPDLLQINKELEQRKAEIAAEDEELAVLTRQTKFTLSPARSPAHTPVPSLASSPIPSPSSSSSPIPSLKNFFRSATPDDLRHASLPQAKEKEVREKKLENSMN